MDQAFCNVRIGIDYPAPIVDLKESAKAARDKIWGHKKHPAVQNEVGRILKLHVNSRSWKKHIYRRKFVVSVNALLHGVKNGNGIGKMLNIVVNGVKIKSNEHN